MTNVVDKLLERLIPRIGRHLSDHALADFFCRESPLVARWSARRHLAHCSYCRLRQEHLVGPRAEHMLAICRDASNDEEASMQEKSRSEFTAWLDLQLRLSATGKRSNSALLRPSWARLSTGIPALSLGLAAGLILGASGLHWWWLNHAPHITSNALLVHAEKWENSSANAAPGVVYQAVQIKTSTQTLRRSLYRDAQGKRRQKPSPWPSEEELQGNQLKMELGEAGIDWDQPLSASGYQAWHDRQHERADHIAFAGAHLLTLTTHVPQGAVREESITVRDTDFHPVRRAVDFRDRETVEIAELDFKVLPWNSIDANAFEPIIEISAPTSATSTMNLPALSLDRAPTSDQLDEAELAARLVLNQLHADSGEQIELHRTAQAIQVEGLVETEQRKHELRAQLLTIPRVKVLIQSESDASKGIATATADVNLQTSSLPDLPSALEIYLRSRGRSVNEINTESRELFRGALCISQESKALVEIGSRFGARSARPVILSATIADLLYSHRERLEIALLHQRSLLASIGDIAAVPVPSPAHSGDPLSDQAARHLALVKELTQTSFVPERIAEAIFAEMAANLDGIDAASSEVYAKSQQYSAMSGKD